jgi:hypothetical protein
MKILKQKEVVQLTGLSRARYGDWDKRVNFQRKSYSLLIEWDGWRMKSQIGSLLDQESAVTRRQPDGKKHIY